MTRLAALTFLLGCTPHIAAPTTPLQVKIIAEPKQETYCWMPDIPKAPELRDLDFDEEDVLRRTMIHRLDWAVAVQWMLEMQSWAEEVKRCVDTLRGVTE